MLARTHLHPNNMFIFESIIKVLEPVVYENGTAVQRMSVNVPLRCECLPHALRMLQCQCDVDRHSNERCRVRTNFDCIMTPGKVAVYAYTEARARDVVCASPCSNKRMNIIPNVVSDIFVVSSPSAVIRVALAAI